MSLLESGEQRYIKVIIIIIIIIIISGELEKWTLYERRVDRVQGPVQMT